MPTERDQEQDSSSSSSFPPGFHAILEAQKNATKSSLVSCLQKDQIVARDLASITGQVISMTCAVGNVARLFKRNYYAAIERRTSWAQPLNVSAAIRDELSFWLSNIDTSTINCINGQRRSPAPLELFILMTVTLDLVVILSSVA